MMNIYIIMLMMLLLGIHQLVLPEELFLVAGLFLRHLAF